MKRLDLAVIDAHSNPSQDFCIERNGIIETFASWMDLVYEVIFWKEFDEWFRAYEADCGPFLDGPFHDETQWKREHIEMAIDELKYNVYQPQKE